MTTSHRQFFVDSEVDRIELGDGFWVDIKRQMSIADFERLEREMASFETEVSTENRNRFARRHPDKVAAAKQLVTANFRPTYVLLLEINIQAWNLPGKDGQVKPVDRASICALTQDIADQLAEEIDRRNPITGRP